jgi:hypothetical protein
MRWSPATDLTAPITLDLRWGSKKGGAASGFDVCGSGSTSPAGALLALSVTVVGAAGCVGGGVGWRTALEHLWRRRYMGGAALPLSCGGVARWSSAGKREAARMIERGNERNERRWGPGRSGRGLGGLLAALLVSLPVTARAQEPPSAEETAAARSLALEGLKLADAGRCDEAIDKLARAEKLHHAPVVLGRLGECQVARGQLVEGTETLRRVLREAVPANPPAVLLKARERAQAVLDRAKGRIGTLNIVLKGGPPGNSGVVVSVDGQGMNLALLEVDRPTDPGFHLVEAGAPGYLSTSARVGLTAGDRQTVVIHLEPDPNAVVAAQPEPSTSEPATPGASEGAPASAAPLAASGQLGVSSAESPAPEEPDYTAAYVAWGAGGAAIAVGSVLGLMAISGKSDLDEQCDGNLCPESSRDQLDSARSLSNAATISFVLGGVGLGLGTFFYFNESPSTTPEGTAKGSSDQASLPSWSARAWVGLGRVGVSGEF